MLHGFHLFQKEYVNRILKERLMTENYWKQNETTAFSVLYAYIDAEGHLAG